VDFWKTQISRFSAPNSLKVIALAVYDDIKAITYRQIVHAGILFPLPPFLNLVLIVNVDVVIVSYSFFMDYNYFFIGNFGESYAESSFSLNSPSDELISEWISKSLMVIYKKQEFVINS
jgi:hypothetical protein